MARYYVRKDGLHEAIRVINGKRKAFCGWTDREVDQKMLAYKESMIRGRRFPEIADGWEREHENTIREATRRAYAIVVRRLKQAFPGYVSEIKPLDLSRYIFSMERRGSAKNSIQAEISVCKMIFSHAVLAGDIDINPAKEIKKAGGLPCKERTALTDQQEEAVRRAEGAQGDAGVCHFLMYTGCRRGEALALSYSDIDRKAGVIHINKKLSYVDGQSPKLEMQLKSKNGLRDIPLLPPLAARLPKNRAGLIFPGKDGGFMRASDITSMWREYCRKVGLNRIEYMSNGDPIETFPITMHCFRHSFATICYEAGIDLRQAAAIIGDTPEIVGRIYTHLRTGHREDAVKKLIEYFEREKPTIEPPQSKIFFRTNTD